MALSRFSLRWLIGIPAILLMSISPTHAAVQTATWAGGAGDWSDASKWSTGSAPNNTATDDFDVAIDAANLQASDVTLNSTVTVKSLTVDAGDRLSLPTSSSRLNTSASGDVTLNGDLTLANGGFVRIGTDASLIGSGRVHLSGASVFNNNGGTFTVGAGITAHGAGTFGNGVYPLVNHGHIAADVAGEQLNVRGNAITNDGTIEVKNNAVLTISGSVTPGVLDSVVNNGGTLKVNGTIDVSGGASFVNGAVNNWRLGNSAILKGGSSGGAIETLPGHDLVSDSGGTFTIDGATINGTVHVNPEVLLVPKGISGNGTVVSGGYITTSLSNFPPPAALTVAQGATLRTPGLADIDTKGPIVIHGTLHAARDAAFVYGTGLQCDGTLRIANGALISGEGSGAVSLAGGGTLDIDLGGPLRPALLNTTNNLDLSGEDFLNLRMLDTSPAASGYLIAQYTGTLSGVFDHVTDGYVVDYSQPHKIYVSSVPEPGAAAMACVVLAGAGLRRRRRSRRK
jgi:MYXO-CTERM domain-containing protein